METIGIIEKLLVIVFLLTVNCLMVIYICSVFLGDKPKEEIETSLNNNDEFGYYNKTETRKDVVVGDMEKIEVKSFADLKKLRR